MNRIPWACLLIALCAAGLWVAAAAPGDKRTVAEHIRGFAVSPDGRRVAFLDTIGLKVADLSRGGARLLLACPPYQPPQGYKWNRHDHARSRWDVAWSPDGKQIAIERDLSYHSCELVLVDPNTAAAKVVDRCHFISGLGWSPDGRLLAWFRESGKQGKRSYRPGAPVVMTDLSELVVSPGAAQPGKWKTVGEMNAAQNGTDLYPRPIWMPDGGSVIFLRDRQTMVLAALDGSVRDSITPKSVLPFITDPRDRRAGAGIESIWGWAPSPDGRIMAIAWFGSLYLHDMPGGRATARTHIAGMRPLSVTWTPDGKGMVFVTTTPESPKGFFPGATGPPHRLHWLSRDGKKRRNMWEEKAGMRDLQCVGTDELFYLSGDRLYQAKLR